MQKQEECEKFIEAITKNKSEIIDLYTSRNKPVEIFSSDDTEVLHAIMFDTSCNGSGGSGWDTSDNAESKTASWAQALECVNTKCKRKYSMFLGNCPFCATPQIVGNKQAKPPKDSRWVISTKSHIQYYDELLEYRIQLVEPTEFEPKCRKFRIRGWIVKKDNKYLNEYINRAENADSINFQPLKKDFYFSSPCLIYDGILDLTNQESKFNFNYFNLDNDIPEEIPQEFSGLDRKEVLANKKMGKRRGDVKRK